MYSYKKIIREKTKCNSWENSLYSYDIATLKKYGETGYKLTLHKALRNSGLEDVKQNYVPKGSVNDEKLDVNISRARSKILELAKCNPWNIFGTFTIDKSKYDRYNLHTYHKEWGQAIQDFNKKNKTNIKYMLIPEQHKDGAWHEHGFLMGLPIAFLRPFTLGEKLPKYIRDKLLNGEVVYDFPFYSDKFGFCDFELIRNQDACAKYVTKYITKDLSKSVKEINAHMYYVSKGLKKATEIKRGSLKEEFSNPDFENDYVKTKWLSPDIPVENFKAIFND